MEDVAAEASPQAAADVTGHVLRGLLQQVGQRRFDAWFTAGIGCTLDAGVLSVRAATSLHRDSYRKHFAAEFKNACLAVGIGKVRVEFSVDPAVATGAGVQALAADCGDAPEGDGSTVGVAPRPVEATADPLPAARPAGWSPPLIAGDANLAALAAARRIVSGQGAPSPLVLWGPSGVGKSTLLKGIAEGARQGKRRRRVMLVTAEQFTSTFVDAVFQRGLTAFRQKHRGVDLLLIDDAQFLIGKPKTLEELLYTLDALSTVGASVVLASDRPPAQLAAAGPELASRLASGVGVELATPGFALRVEILHQLASRVGVPLSDAQARTIAAGVLGAARELQGVVNQLDVACNLAGEPLTDTLVARAIDDLNRHVTPRVSVRDIQSAVSRVFGLDSGAIHSKERSKRVAEPRMLAMWLARKYTHAAWSDLGDQFGNRAHSTVIHACQRVDALLTTAATVNLPGGRCRLHEALQLVERELRTA